ncbi:MAG: ATP-binding cassette domain-containing protein [Flavobacteriales bacterium]|nr:ATP-binding cassette domain-containing protein [Flavobacteriales bacterium]
MTEETNQAEEVQSDGNSNNDGDDRIVYLKDATIAQNDHPVLSDVNFEIKKGEFYYLIGKTGAGKSSLLKTLYGDLKLTKGEGAVTSFDLKKIKTKQVAFLRRNLGIVFQDFQLLNDRSVDDNINFVMAATGWTDKNKIKERREWVLDRVDLGTKGFKMPHELSGGEQQRVSIARALINNPDLILADEPTGNLDPETSDDIMELLIKISQNNRAVLMATHDYSLIKKFPSKILKCENGKVSLSSLEDESISRHLHG